MVRLSRVAICSGLKPEDPLVVPGFIVGGRLGVRVAGMLIAVEILEGVENVLQPDISARARIKLNNIWGNFFAGFTLLVPVGSTPSSL